jgi:hypothetical protein
MADWRCSRCSWVNRDWQGECHSCGATREEGAQELAARADVRADGTSLVVPAPAGATNPGATTAAPPGVPGLLGGLAAGALAGALGTAIWYAVVVVTEYEIGFIAVVVGWLVGTAVVFGARQRVSIPLVAASGLLTLAALSVSQYLIVYHVLTQAIGFPLGLLEAPELIIELAVESIRADPVTLLFWGIALFQAVYIPFRQMRPSEAGSGPDQELSRAP